MSVGIGWKRYHDPSPKFDERYNTNTMEIAELRRSIEQLTSRLGHAQDYL